MPKFVGIEHGEQGRYCKGFNLLHPPPPLPTPPHPSLHPLPPSPCTLFHQPLAIISAYLQHMNAGGKYNSNFQIKTLKKSVRGKKYESFPLDSFSWLIVMGFANISLLTPVVLKNRKILDSDSGFLSSDSNVWNFEREKY
jgi:hypothetical protein